MNKYFLTTNDVETTSLVHHALTPEAGKLVLTQGLPRLLDLYSKYNVKSTFFFTGEIVEQFPEVVKLILPYKHEVGCHGYSHQVHEAFDVLSYDKQIEHLTITKKMLEDITGEEVISFRAPALRVNSDTPKALAQTGFLIDSSVASQRFDFFFSYGSLKKFKNLITPRIPYYTSIDDLKRKGESKILEIPISAMLYPYIGTTLRIFPRTTAFFRNLLEMESNYSGKPINFITHPNEFMDEERVHIHLKKRSKNIIASFFADRLRYHLKLKNLGAAALPLYEKEIKHFLNNGFRFVTMREYKRDFDDNNKPKI